MSSADHVPTADAPAVARLKDAGAIVFGKTNLPRWSGDFQTYNELFGTTNNPWDVRSHRPAARRAARPRRSPPASPASSSAPTSAARCASRRTAAACSALKPSFGVVPQRGYLDHVGGGTTDADINVFGPIARSADDLDLLLGVLAGPEPERAVAWRIDLPACEARSLADLRIGAWLDDPASPIESEYAAMLRAAADRLADAGAQVDDDRPPVDFARATRAVRPHDRAARWRRASPDGGRPRRSSGSHLAWLRGEEDRAALRRTWAEWFERHDLLLCPVVTVPAFPHDHDRDIMEPHDRDRRRVAVRWSASSTGSGSSASSGLPSAVVPIGRTAAGLPVGMQIVAPYLHDRRAVRAAQLVSDVLGGYEVPPGF